MKNILGFFIINIILVVFVMSSTGFTKKTLHLFWIPTKKFYHCEKYKGLPTWKKFTIEEITNNKINK